MMIYMATDKPVNEIPWNEDKPAFHVVSVNEKGLPHWGSEEISRVQNALKNIFKPKLHYYIGSSEGCGCNFAHATLQEKDDSITPVDYGVVSKNQEQEILPFFEYLTELSRDLLYIEIYGRWAGDEGLSPLKITEIGLSEIDPKRFVFGEGELFKIKLRE